MYVYHTALYSILISFIGFRLHKSPSSLQKFSNFSLDLLTGFRHLVQKLYDSIQNARFEMLVLLVQGGMDHEARVKGDV